MYSLKHSALRNFYISLDENCIKYFEGSKGSKSASGITCNWHELKITPNEPPGANHSSSFITRPTAKWQLANDAKSSRAALCARMCVRNNKVSLINFCTPRMPPPHGTAVKIHSSTCRLERDPLVSCPSSLYSLCI